MNFVGINGWEFVVLVVLAVLVLGPDRLPQYAAKLARLVYRAREMAEGAKGQLRDQMGPEFDEIDWKQYDPRQYDPRRIVREAMSEPLPGSPASGGATAADPDPPAEWGGPVTATRDPALGTPYDIDAT